MQCYEATFCHIELPEEVGEEEEEEEEEKERKKNKGKKRKKRKGEEEEGTTEWMDYTKKKKITSNKQHQP